MHAAPAVLRSAALVSAVALLLASCAGGATTPPPTAVPSVAPSAAPSAASGPGGEEADDASAAAVAAAGAVSRPSNACTVLGPTAVPGSIQELHEQGLKAFGLVLKALVAQRVARKAYAGYKWMRRLPFIAKNADEQVGRIVNALEASDLLDDTLIVITADHGELFGERVLRQRGST